MLYVAIWYVSIRPVVMRVKEELQSGDYKGCLLRGCSALQSAWYGAEICTDEKPKDIGIEYLVERAVHTYQTAWPSNLRRK